MIHFFRHFILVTGLISLLFGSANLYADVSPKQSLQDVVHSVLKNYPSLKIARIEIERARQEFSKIESQLGWTASAQTGVSRDVGIFNIPSERFDLSASIGSRQKSGHSIEVTGQYSYEDSESVAVPSIVNPSERTALDLNYRIPLGQGEENPDYQQGLISAEAGVQSTKAARIKQIDALVRQTLSLYYDIANTYMRIKDANEAIRRADRLRNFVKKNAGLGLSESKDLLIVNALLSAKVSDRDNLLIIWSQQRSELNRLLGVEPTSDFKPVIVADKTAPERNAALNQAYEQNPDILLQQAQLSTADVGIELANDAKKDRLDLVFSVGARNTSGDVATGSASDSEWAGGARLEYQFSLDQRGFDAGIYQAMLDKQAIEEEIERIKHDLQYSVTGLLDQINQNTIAARSSKKRLDIEQKKVKEAFERYKVGRADTNELIDNENSLYIASLLYETRKIELARKYTELELLLGSLWDRQLLLDENQAVN